MTEMTLNRLRAVVIAMAPVVLLGGFLTLPYISNYMDAKALAGAVGAAPARTMWAAIVLGGAMGLILAAVFAVRLLLRDAGENRWSPFAVFLIAVGGTLLVAITSGVEGVALAGQDRVKIATAMNDWLWVQFAGGALFGLGWLALAAAIYRARVLGPQLTWLVVVAIVISVIANFVPFGWALYVIGVSAIVGMWPLAYRVWAPSRQARPAAGMAHA